MWGTGKGPYRVSALLVLPRDTARKPRRQERGYGLRCLHREQERGVPVGILADTVVFVTGVYEELLAPSLGNLLLPPLKQRRARRFGLLTAISNSPSCAARWSEVLPLSAKSGFCRLSGLFLMMR